MTERAPVVVIDDELELLASLLPLDGLDIVELGCGPARLARELLARHPSSRLTGLEVDARQHAQNLAAPPVAGLRFVAGGAQAIPLPDAAFDLALMLKSLHHVPVAEMGRALGEIHRVLRPAGFLYVSEPVYAGALNEVVRQFNDEGAVRAAAQRALDEAIASGAWTQQDERLFETPVRFRDFADFEARMMHPSFADHRIDEAIRARTRAAFEPHCTADGARFARPMHVRLLRAAR